MHIIFLSTCPQKFCIFKKFFIYLSDREADIEKRDLPPIDSLRKWLQQPGLTQADARSLELHPCPLCGTGTQWLEPSFSAFPGTLQKAGLEVEPSGHNEIMPVSQAEFHSWASRVDG